MPELPEVQFTCSQLQTKYCLDKQIVAINTNITRKEDIYLNSDEKQLSNLLLNNFVTSIGRKGKYTWFELKKTSSRTRSNKIVGRIFFHQMLTGAFHVRHHLNLSHRYKRFQTY